MIFNIINRTGSYTLVSAKLFPATKFDLDHLDWKEVFLNESIFPE